MALSYIGEILAATNSATVLIASGDQLDNLQLLQMNSLLHLAGRKGKTFGLIIAKCSNWPAVARAKLQLGGDPELIRFRDGFVLKILPPLYQTWGEIFEPAIADLYRIADASPDLIIDVGANIGAFACRAAYLHPHATVHAFEPSGKHAAVLKENIVLNRLTNVKVHDAAVTKDGREVLFAAIGSGGGSGIFLHDSTEPISMRSITLSIVPMTEAKNLFVKLDCEGAKGEIIEWICANVQLFPPRLTLACEYHHWCPIPLEDLIHLLRANGFAAEPRTLFDESYLFASRGQIA